MKYVVIKAKTGWIVQNTTTFTVVFLGLTELDALRVAARLNGTPNAVSEI